MCKTVFVNLGPCVYFDVGCAIDSGVRADQVETGGRRRAQCGRNVLHLRHTHVCSTNRQIHWFVQIL